MMVTLAALPSTSVGLVVTRSATLGVANGLAVALGIVLGDLVFILLAVFGLSVVAETMGWLFLLVKYLGGVYLLWLGWTLLRSVNLTSIPIDKASSGSLAASFISGFAITLGDIKAIFFYMSLFPTFIDLNNLQALDLLTIIFITIGSVGGVKSIYAVLARKVALMLRSRKFERVAKTVAGSCMIGAGAYLLVTA